MPEKSENTEIITAEQSAKNLVRANQTKFRTQVQDIIRGNMGRMQEVLDTLDPKEFCDVMIKLMPFGFAKVPDETQKKTDTADPKMLREIVTRELMR